LRRGMSRFIMTSMSMDRNEGMRARDTTATFNGLFSGSFDHSITA
jgi:hypothetical protein